MNHERFNYNLRHLFLGKIPKVTLFINKDRNKINLNEKIAERTYNDFTHPNLKKGHIHQVYVTHINKDGSLLVQWQNIANAKYTKYMNELLNIDFSKHTNYAHENKIPNEILITRWSQDNLYYRCKVLSISANRESVEVLFVDFGNTDTLVLKDSVLYLAKKVLRPLSWFPFQVTKIVMEGLESHRIERMKEIMPIDEAIWIKVMDKEKRCEFFKLVDGIYFSVNDALKLEAELPTLIYSTDDVLEIESKLTELSKKLDHIWGNTTKNSKIINKKSKSDKMVHEHLANLRN